MISWFNAHVNAHLQKALGAIQAANAAGAFSYNKFVAIGLFRLLELTGAKEPAALERLVKSVGIKPEPVNRDLLLYKVYLLPMRLGVTLSFECVHAFMSRGMKTLQATRLGPGYRCFICSVIFWE